MKQRVFMSMLGFKITQFLHLEFELYLHTLKKQVTALFNRVWRHILWFDFPVSASETVENISVTSLTQSITASHETGLKQKEPSY